jgi:hypothetical protein
MPGEVEGSRGITRRLFHEIPWLRFAPLAITPNQL